MCSTSPRITFRPGLINQPRGCSLIERSSLSNKTKRQQAGKVEGSSFADAGRTGGAENRWLTTRRKGAGWLHGNVVDRLPTETRVWSRIFCLLKATAACGSPGYATLGRCGLYPEFIDGDICLASSRFCIAESSSSVL